MTNMPIAPSSVGTNAPPCSSRMQRQSRPVSASRRFVSAVAGTAAIALSLCGSPAFAGDPFRTTNQHAIGKNTEAAFKAIFERGDYQAARKYLSQAEPSEPLSYAMKASLAYLDKDWNALRTNATKTRETAEQLRKTDPLRGNLYVAVGEFMEGAYIVSREGTVRGTPQALNKLQRVFQSLNAAEKLSPQDPELNLVKGFMDLMLAVNLPFANPADAVERLNKYAQPRYLAYRGIAIGYRDLNQPTKALEFVDQALKVTPNNPDLYYLKAQVLVKQGKNQESLEFFRKALDKTAQLPRQLRNQIAYERCRTEFRIDQKERNCSTELKK
ncbi:MULTISPECIES: Sll0314/Alr1548 family TPR repeat-containing protein [Trichocoleus]|uniref:Tetratricopeptide repeat protein n=1 Tax=Trichocoleus desertorum GB2-A4 TaxID=2933944 RepID=A0ABV0J7E2_9CYAN|nr:Sll0314/Alr1548 family TPR repeat-containing protein [Trichocoleus sp. FACHB-46]